MSGQAPMVHVEPPEQDGQCAGCGSAIVGQYVWRDGKIYHPGCVAPKGQVINVKAVMSTICRVGDAMLWAWGESTKNGYIEALMDASSGDLSGLLDVTIASVGGSPRAPGVHSNPTLSRLIAAELETDNQKRKLLTAVYVECEVSRWRRARETAFWVRVATEYYAGPFKSENKDVGRALGISERSVEGARTGMRRCLALPVVLTRAAA